jgi:hypothetical protein
VRLTPRSSRRRSDQRSLLIVQGASLPRKTAQHAIANAIV